MMASKKQSNCPHVSYVDSVTWEELRTKHELKDLTCNTCDVKANNLWLCLVGACQYIGCGESVKDHSSEHAMDKKHSMTINLSTLRIWCYACESEVFPGRNKPFFTIPENSASVLSAKKKNSMLRKSASSSTNSSPTHGNSSAGEESDSDLEDENVKPRGLTGLQNLGNTCYLNSALQALSNCPPLSRFFLDCHGFVQPEKNPKLSRSYQRLISEVWHKRRPSYVIPNSVVNGIKVVHPMFRGYSQQDAQEFLRCFMDELHEELKQPLPCDSDENDDDSDDKNGDEPCKFIASHDRQLSMDSTSSSQSEDFYETCDSGLSSERCSADVTISGEDGEAVQNTENSTHSNKIDSHSRVSAGKTYARLRQNEEKGGKALKEDTVVASKHLKETVNQMSKRSGSTVTINSTTCTEDSGRPDDFPSDGESHQRRVRSKSSPRFKRASESTEAFSTMSRNSYSTKINMNKKGKQKNVQYQSVISDIFDGKILSSVQCLTCERVSTTKETFQDLSLPIPGKDHLNMIHHSAQGGPPKGGACGEVHQGWFSFMFTWMKSWFVGPTINLQDCLAAFFSADELKGDNMYSCEKCKKLRNGIKYSKVLELPEILCVHLKRFRHEFYSSKISSYVAFPLDGLDMKPYTHKDCKSEVMIYDLIAVICHHGTAGAGHYTAYCLNYTNEQWYEFDDQYVTEVDINQVINCEAYVLFYRKRNDKMISIRQKAMQLKETQESSLLQFFVSKQWINRFNMFAEPGPITNFDFLCPHGGVPPNKVDHVEDLVESFDQSLWENLHGRFSGGPVCNHLYACSTCQTDLDNLIFRQKTELEQFIALNEKFKDEDNPHIIYAISMTWFKEWENFVRKRTSTPPGSVDNKAISMMRNGQLIVRHNSDYGQLSEDMWQFLLGIYHGGPAVVIKQVSSLRSSSPTNHLSSSPSASSLNLPKSNEGQTTPTQPQQPLRVLAKQAGKGISTDHQDDHEDKQTRTNGQQNSNHGDGEDRQIRADGQQEGNYNDAGEATSEQNTNHSAVETKSQEDGEVMTPVQADADSVANVRETTPAEDDQSDVERREQKKEE
ncbi:ubiquitin carboxyl-terminal hydrolase 20-like [Mizuhopecten yessoensis]|uniref:ubiquitinyl hydrolase 1 n=1 Tax=Mizuhopecten yessoensis TaxID=6573 RepID=A0A210QTF4_MIZYE|nr:ubiquitin carboxyl-terminal hydrolase 20-like [Mizuhopecten yessoensis]OWF52023.1 Ubiquitin carboxyl-terminal hydrolase 20 [Mizuhopecten yessoensis]